MFSAAHFYVFCVEAGKRGSSNRGDKNHIDKNRVDKIIFDRTGVLNMLSTPLAGDRTGVRSVAGSDFIYYVTKNSARPRFDFNMCTRGGEQ